MKQVALAAERVLPRRLTNQPFESCLSGTTPEDEIAPCQREQNTSREAVNIIWSET